MKKQAIKTPGFFLVLVGPDGCGKSTISRLVQERCQQIFPAIAHFHLYPKQFSTLDNRSQQRWQSRQKVSSEWENRSRKNSFSLSILRSFYLIFRFWTGYLFWIYPRLLKGQLVIGERWTYDLLFDPASKGIELPLWWLKFCLRLTPVPNKVVALIGNAGKIQIRKPELPVEEIERQIKLIETSRRQIKNLAIIDATVEVETTFENILKHICE